MSGEPTAAGDAALALALLAVAPKLGGLQICGLPGPGRDALLARAEHTLNDGRRAVRLPLGVSPERLLGGLDLAASLAASSPNGAGLGKPILQEGLLTEADGGLLLVNMAERQSREVASALTAALDRGEYRLERDGFSTTRPARFVALALDEALEDDEAMDGGLTDRLAFRSFSDTFHELPAEPFTEAQIRAAREALPPLAEQAIATLDRAALSMGITSLRRVRQAALAACALAGLRKLQTVGAEEIGDAARLVLLPHALTLPSPEEPEPEAPEPPDSRAETDSDPGEADREPAGDQIPDEMLIAAAKAVLPPGLLASLSSGKNRRRAGAGGRSRIRRPATRGRPIGIRRGHASRGPRLNLLATIKAAAPWQRLRGGRKGRLAVRTDDFRVSRFKQKTQLTTVFVVDASGSSAMQRLGEVKGAIELLLADCYVRRDQVALLAFRGSAPELLLPPTRSLARAKRALSDLPGGGATPLAGALDAARELAAGLQRKHQQPVLVVLTDGRGNVGRDGTPGHPEAASQTLDAAGELGLEGFNTLLVDVARRPRKEASELADTLGASYLVLPRVDAHSLSAAVQQASAP
ncbi:MAG: magnesium chelatase subunit D [Pseudomonadota bacterium]